MLKGGGVRRTKRGMIFLAGSGCNCSRRYEAYNYMMDSVNWRYVLMKDYVLVTVVYAGKLPGPLLATVGNRGVNPWEYFFCKHNL